MNPTTFELVEGTDEEIKAAEKKAGEALHPDSTEGRRARSGDGNQ